MGNKSLSKIANISGSENYDISTAFSDHFFSDISTLRSIGENFVSLFFNGITLSSFLKGPDDLNNEKNLQNFLRITLSSNNDIVALKAQDSVLTLIKNDILLYNQLLNFTLPDKISWVNLSPGVSTPKKPKQSKKGSPPIVVKLTFLRNIFRFLHLSVNFLDEILRSRQLFKMAVMTYSYNAGRTSRINGFSDFLINHSITQGFSFVNNADIFAFSQFINLFFQLQMKTLLPECDTFLGICSDSVSSHVSKHKDLTPLSVTDLPFLSWHFSIPLRHNSHKIRQRINFSKLKNALFKTFRFSIAAYQNILDRSSMITTFAIIYVHSIEATSLLHLFTLVADINYALRQVGLPPIFIFSNHDSIGVNIL